MCHPSRQNTPLLEQRIFDDILDLTAPPLQPCQPCRVLSHATDILRATKPSWGRRYWCCGTCLLLPLLLLPLWLPLLLLQLRCSSSSAAAVVAAMLETLYRSHPQHNFLTSCSENSTQSLPPATHLTLPTRSATPLPPTPCLRTAEARSHQAI